MDSEPEYASKGFEIKRAYLGYKYNLSDDFSTKITFDVGKKQEEASIFSVIS